MISEYDFELEIDYDLKNIC